VIVRRKAAAIGGVPGNIPRLPMSDPAIVFEDREVPGQWRVEQLDNEGGCEVSISSGPDARKQAIDYASAHYDVFLVKRFHR
jgi:hypothetical protein